MDSFLGYVLDDYKNGLLTKATAVETLAHVIAAIDINNHAEAITCFQQGRKFLSTLHGK